MQKKEIVKSLEEILEISNYSYEQMKEKVPWVVESPQHLDAYRIGMIAAHVEHLIKMIKEGE